MQMAQLFLYVLLYINLKWHTQKSFKVNHTIQANEKNKKKKIMKFLPSMIMKKCHENGKKQATWHVLPQKLTHFTWYHIIHKVLHLIHSHVDKNSAPFIIIFENYIKEKFDQWGQFLLSKFYQNLFSWPFFH